MPSADTTSPTFRVPRSTNSSSPAVYQNSANISCPAVYQHFVSRVPPCLLPRSTMSSPAAHQHFLSRVPPCLLPRSTNTSSPAVYQPFLSRRGRAAACVASPRAHIQELTWHSKLQNHASPQNSVNLGKGHNGSMTVPQRDDEQAPPE
jgi:hypothetical protein